MIDSTPVRPTAICEHHLGDTHSHELCSLDGDFDLLAHDERWDLHAITGLLKMYLREVPSILTHELHMHFLGVTGEI